MKRLLKHPLTQAIVAWLLSLTIRFVYVSSRKKYHYAPDALPYLRGEHNAIFAFWHGRMMMCPTIEPPGRKMHVMISAHRDGLLISKVIGHFGEATIQGSSSKGGREAVMVALRLLKKGDNISITPDGPRGPAQVAQEGVAVIARLAGLPVIPVTFSATRKKHLRSWDRFLLALPFGRIHFCVGAPIRVERDEDTGIAREKIELAMNALVHQADEAAHA